jgi:hypothetical protein
MDAKPFMARTMVEAAHRVKVPDCARKIPQHQAVEARLERVT